MNEEKEELKTFELKRITFTEHLNFAIRQCLLVQDDFGKYAFAVENLESLLWDELENNNSYQEILNKKWAKLDEKYGIKGEEKKLKEFYLFKFRELMKHVKHKIPLEVELVL